MIAFRALDIETQGLGCGVRPNGCIAGIGEWAGLTIAEAGHVVFVAAEGLIFLAEPGMKSVLNERDWCACEQEGSIVESILEFEGAELLVDNLPHDFVGRHGWW